MMLKTLLITLIASTSLASIQLKKVSVLSTFPRSQPKIEAELKKHVNMKIHQEAILVSREEQKEKSPDGTYLLSMGKEINSGGDTAVYPLTISENGKQSVVAKQASYASISPNSRWILVDGKFVYDVKSKSLVKINSTSELQSYVSILYWAKDSLSFIAVGFDCPYDCPASSKTKILKVELAAQ